MALLNSISTHGMAPISKWGWTIQIFTIKGGSVVGVTPHFIYDLLPPISGNAGFDRTKRKETNLSPSNHQVRHPLIKKTHMQTTLHANQHNNQLNGYFSQQNFQNCWLHGTNVFIWTNVQTCWLYTQAAAITSSYDGRSAEERRRPAPGRKLPPGSTLVAVALFAAPRVASASTPLLTCRRPAFRYRAPSCAGRAASRSSLPVATPLMSTNYLICAVGRRPRVCGCCSSTEVRQACVLSELSLFAVWWFFVPKIHNLNMD